MKKRRTSLIGPLVVIFVTTVFINIISTIDATLVPDCLDRIKPLFQGTLKFTSLMILLIINLIFGYWPVIRFFSIGGKKWIMNQYLPAIFNALFKTRIKELLESNPLALDKCMYRVTCFRYQSRKKYRLNFWWQFITRRLRKSTREKRRILEKDKGYLVCYGRYGLENGEFVTKNSSLIYEVTNKNFNNLDIDEVKGTAGRTFVNDKNTTYALDNVGINTILKQIIEQTKQSGEYESMITERKHLSISNSIRVTKRDLKEECSKENLQKLIDFIRDTNTDFVDLFSIKEGFHSNHFLGFKIFDENDKVWGVIVIDAYEDTEPGFWEIVNPKSISKDIKPEVCKEWVDCILNSFSNLMSESTINLVLKTEEKNGKRIRSESFRN